MNTFDHFKQSQNIARRYFIVNGFDGALTILGIIVGFYFSDNTSIDVVIKACTGAAVALGVSGISSAYISEYAERKKELQELEAAMVHDLSDSTQEEQSKKIPIYIAIINGAAPFLVSLIIISPLFLFSEYSIVVIDPLLASMIIACVVLFLMGVFLGLISHTFWIWSGMRTLLVAFITISLIYLLS